MLTPEEIARLRADSEGIYPTAQDLRDDAETLYWLSLRTDSHEGHDDKERYRGQARKLMRVAAILEANPNYFTDDRTMRVAA